MPNYIRQIQLVLLTLLFAGALPGWAETVNVNFVVLALDGTRALTISNQAITVGTSMYSQFPEEYKSPFLDNGDLHFDDSRKGDFAFYRTEANAKESQKNNFDQVKDIHYISEVTNDLEGTTVYVVYRYDVSKSKAKGFLSGGSYTLETYNNKVNNGEWLCYQGTWDTKSTPVTIGTEKYETNTWRSNLLYTKTSYKEGMTDAEKSMYIYTINIEDPYQVTILSHVSTKVSGVNQDREDWYFCGGTNPGDVRLQPTLAGAKTYHIWSYAILPGYNTNPTSSEPDAETYRIIVTDNYNYNNARSYSNWSTTFTSPNTPDGHYYLNNRGMSTKTCFHLRNGGSTDIREGANHRIVARKATRFAFVVKTHVSGQKLIDYVVTDFDSENHIEMPERMKRKYCSYEYYLDSTFTTRVGEGADFYTTYKNAYEGDGSHKGGYSVFYVKYTVSDVPFQFSTEDHPKWYSIRTGAEVKSEEAIDANYKYIHYESNTFKEKTPGVNGMAADNTFWFAFVGDPYEVKVINRNAGTNKYIGIAANANTGVNLQAKNGATDQMVWSMVDSDGTPSDQFYLRLFGLDKTPAHFAYTATKPMTFNVSAAPLLVETIPGYDYVFKIVNNSGSIALQYTATNMLPGETPLDAMPDHLKSPAATNYRFYKTQPNAVTDNGSTGKVSLLSDVGATAGGDIYVRYDLDPAMTSKPYDVMVNGKYIYVNSSNNLEIADDASAQTLARRSWVFDGNDPYKITLRTLSAEDRWLTDSDPVTYAATVATHNYAFLYGNGDKDNYALALANGNKDDAIMYLGRSADNALNHFGGIGNGYDPIDKKATGNSTIQVTLQDVQAMCTYTIVDHEGNEAIRLYEKVEVFPMAVPDKIKSPLAKNWRFYTTPGDAIKDAKHETPAHAPVTSFTYEQFLGGVLDVWVRYDTDDGQVKLNAADGTTDNPFYTLEFTDQSSPKIYMESNNIPTDNYERPSWAYVNGFGQFYLYGDQLHEDIFSEGRSNRTRFLWYFQGNDPYNVEIMSYQKRSSKNMYFRTYYDNGLARVVNVLTQKDYGLLYPTSGDEVQADSIPSKYMILGTLDAAQFTTREYFSGEQHTIEQLEHGWRYAGESAGTEEIDELFAQKGIKPHHLDFDQQHWFVTTQMGKTVKIFEEELVPVLVLIDRHGWRLKYWPFSRRNNEAIRLFDSPMVTNYRWYYDGQVALTGEDGGTNTITKTTGYYHYVIPEGATPNFESTELSWTYWNEHKTGTYESVNINIYVTYDVEGAEGWTDSQTGPDCMLDKNGVLGYFDSGSKTIMSNNYTNEYLRSHYFEADSLYLNDQTISDEKLWKLERNPDIDAEMGYTEAEQLTYSEEQQLFDPYNLRIRTKEKYDDKPYYLSATYNTESNELTSIIEMTDDPGQIRASRREDDNIRQITGATWMYVQDLEGHPRLVPRFDKDYSLTDLSRMQETASMNFPEQWSRITPIKEYTLHVREQGSGEEVLTPTPTITARAFAGKPITLKDEHRRHWCEYNEFHSQETEVETGIYTDTIKSFPYMASDIYAVFDYTKDAPRFSKTADEAWWYNMGVTSPTPKYADGTGPTNVAATATATTNDKKWLWGFVGTPYSFNIISYYKKYLNTSGQLSETAAYWTAPVGLKDSDTEVPYFKLKDSNSYLVISSGELAVNGTTPTVASNKITLTSKNNATFKIINLSGKLALEFSSDVAEVAGDGLAVPEFARSPLASDFRFYTQATEAGDIYTVSDETEKDKNYRPVFGETIYVTYKYDNNTSTIDLSGKAMFNIGNLNTGYYLYQGTYGSEVSGEWSKKDKESDPSLNGNTFLWYLCGNDPYDIHITNKNKDADYWLSPQASADGKEYVMRLKSDGSGARFNKFILVNGSQTTDDGNCYRLMAAYPTASATGEYRYVSRKNTTTATGGRFLKNTDTDLATYADLKLIPKTFIMVRYHLTRKVTGEEMVSQPVQAVCKSDITLPDGWQRNYCTYTYKTQYKADDQTYLPSNPMVNVTQVPFLTSDTDELPLIDMYVDYEVGTLPFNLIPTATNKKAEIEALTEETFKLDTYEERLAKGFSDTKTDGYLYFLVMNTNNGLATGKQHFLQREETTGRINYLSNDYELHKSADKNVNKWGYSRLAEYYRPSKLAPFRDESWLWAFAGDPYDLYVFNVEGVIEKEYDTMEEKTTLTYHPRHALGYKTLSRNTKDKNGVETTTYEYVPNTVDYAEDDGTFRGYRWGLGMPAGTNSDQTFSLVVNEMDAEGYFVPDGTTTPRYWRYAKSDIDNKNEVVMTTRAENFKGLDYNLAVLPYIPTRYEDVQLEIRRLDNIFYNMSEVGTGGTHTKDDLQPQTSGISELYYAASTRQFAKGDIISGDVEKLPIEAIRHFCDYTIYEDVYDVKGSYTVKAGPYREGTEGAYTYKDKDDNAVPESDWPQRLYVSYKVTNDMFLAERPTKAQVTEMVNNNDHVFFMDFTQNLGEESYKKGRHAYFDGQAFFTKDDKTKLKYDGEGNPILIAILDEDRKPIKDKYGENIKTVDTENDKDKYNHKQFNTTGNRMETVPENLKWYFVGDPYAVQVYCTAGEWSDDGTTAANLCRFDPTESRFQYIVDCVHLRLPDTKTIDPRPWLVYYEENATTLKKTGKAVQNPYYNKPIYDNFYWEVVPSIKGSTGAGKDYFALRFKRDNVQLKYKDVYYYLAGANKSKTYLDGTYNINLSYNSDNNTYLTGTNKGKHTANDADCVIKLVQPAKVYISAYRPDDQNLNDYVYPDGERITNEELSEYFGVGETLTEVPQHLKRKFVEYGQLTNVKNDATASSHKLENNSTVAFNLETCVEPSLGHSNTYYRIDNTETPDKMTKRASYKFKVNYRTSDLSNGDGGTVNLFTTQAAFNIGRIQWLDFTVGKDNWPYFDKLETAKPALISNYRTAVDDKNADGWNDGLKGLHWAFIGDPYDFTIVNRRQYDDNRAEYNWLAGEKRTINDYAGTPDSVIWVTKLVNAPTATNTSSETAALDNDSINTHWSLQMWKTGSSKDYFLRTASLKTEVVDATIGDYANNYSDGSGNRNQTNNYWRVVAKKYNDGETYFVAVPFSLADKGTYSSNKTASNYSKTMVGAGVTENLLDIRTAVAKDEDEADNDCFDADVRIYTNGGLLRISQNQMELRYDDITSALPVSLRRYGCNYRCYLDYNPETGEGIVITDFDDDETKLKNDKTFRQLVADSLANADDKRITVSYVYTFEDVEEFFTPEQDAKTEDFTWLNTYFNWMQQYSGTNVEREYYAPIFDHYVYNADGHIIDEVYRYERRTEIIKNANEKFETNAFLNTHTSQEPVYADEGAQSEDDRQKWALVGDPYAFTLKNYAQYLNNIKATVGLENERATTTNLPALAQNFALALDEDGKIYLGIINDNNIVNRFLTFEYSTTSDKTLYATGTGTNMKDPTGNTLDTGGAKHFALTNLLRYADLLNYHLVIAHQHSLDHTDHTATDDDVNKCIANHLYEFLKYRALYEKRDSSYYLTYAAGNANGIQSERETDVDGLIQHHGTLRDLYTYPIDDNTVARVGIGNHPQVPWYMKRQFCSYTIYQRDVMRSVVCDGKNGTTASPSYAEADDAWIANGGRYKEIAGVKYKVDPNSPFADPKYDNVLYRTFIENGEEKVAYNIMWVSVTNVSYWEEWKEGDDADTKYTVTAADVDKWGNGLVEGVVRKKPKYHQQVTEQNGRILERLNESHYNRKVLVDVLYEVNTDQFQFADQGTETTAWYQMMTNNDRDGLMNFSYKDGVGARQDRSTHYTNDYLWAPEGDPYGFVLRSRYATRNGTGWDDVAVTTTGALPKEATPDATPTNEGLKATYASTANSECSTPYAASQIVDATEGTRNAVYEMMIGSFNNSFLMHPTAAWTDINDSNHESYYMIHVTDGNATKLVKASPNTLMTNPDANWRLIATTSQLLPYFQRAGYVGGLDPVKAQDFGNQELYNQLQQYDKAGSQPHFSLLRKAQELVYTPANLVALGEGGYYRIAGFSTDALNKAEGATGINGQRYVSGYRFNSEIAGTKPLRFFETAKDDATIHTFADLTTAKGFSDATHGSTVLQGNIELLPADFDPSSIFHFEKATGGEEGRYTLGTQGLNVQASVGSTSMSTDDGTPLRIDDIGGAAVTLRILGEGTVGSHIKTNYLNSNDDSYALTFTTNNELNETDGGIQDTKWLLQPVGVKEQWPYNQMPLRVEVHQGGVKNQNLTGGDLTAETNKDPYYYGTLYVPYDTRLQSTIDAAFTLVVEPTETTEKVTMQSVSQYNGMGNPQYVPANWPVVLRTDKPGTIAYTGFGTKNYVNMYLPYDSPQTVEHSKNQLHGEYLEQSITTGKRVMVFGLPYKGHATTPNSDTEAEHHQYDEDKQVGWYSNDNWVRETNSGYRLYGGYPATAPVATDDQRSNKYVYHNRVYLFITATEEAPSRHIVALFDGEEEQPWQEDRPIDDTVGGDLPWPCDVYDLQGRRVAENETPQTLRKNHPHLRKGVYIFGGHKVVVR